MFHKWVLVSSVIATTFVASPVATGEPLTSKQGKEIIQELRQIRKLLENPSGQGALQMQQAKPLPGPLALPAMGNNAPPPPPETATLNIGDAPYMGQKDAPLVLAMYTDYECPFCRQFDTETLPKINEAFVATGKLKFVVLDAPLDIHQTAKKVAEATKCAEDQNRYWEYRNKLSFGKTTVDMGQAAQDSGLNIAKFNECLNSGKHSAFVAKASANAQQLGITGTPTFVLGTEKNGVLQGQRIMGALPYATFEQKIKELLPK